MTDNRDPADILLGLMVPGSPSAPLFLEDRRWAAIDAMGEQHRLLPLLHHQVGRLENSNCPSGLLRRWREAARASTLSVLLAKSDLLHSIDLLHEAKIHPILLKGGYLALACYPQPGLRPLRDLDLWVDRGDALDAFALLVEAGYRPLDPGDPAQALARHHQLPALEAPSGTPVELHLRMSHAPDGPDPRAHSRIWSIDGRDILTPTPAMMLLHLVIHAAYDHRFDNGPITLADAALLIGQEAIDANEWEAISTRWRPGCDLVLALLRLHGLRVPDHLSRSAVDDAAIALAAALMTQDMDQRDAARVASGPSVGLADTLFPDADRRALLYGDGRASLTAHWRRLMTQRFPALLRGRTGSRPRQLRNIDAAYRRWLENPPQS